MQSVISSHWLSHPPGLVWSSSHLSALALGVGVGGFVCSPHSTDTFSEMAASCYMELLLSPSKIAFPRRKVSISGVGLSLCSTPGSLGQGTSWNILFLLTEISASALQITIRTRGLPECPHIFQAFRVTIPFNLHIKQLICPRVQHSPIVAEDAWEVAGAENLLVTCTPNPCLLLTMTSFGIPVLSHPALLKTCTCASHPSAFYFPKDGEGAFSTCCLNC